MVSAQEIFESLMKDPNHFFLGEKSVEQEAIRRARQHHNNEKALSMAEDTPAMEKFSSFINLEKIARGTTKQITDLAKQGNFLAAWDLKLWNGLLGTNKGDRDKGLAFHVQQPKSTPGTKIEQNIPPKTYRDFLGKVHPDYFSFLHQVKSAFENDFKRTEIDPDFQEQANYLREFKESRNLDGMEGYLQLFTPLTVDYLDKVYHPYLSALGDRTQRLTATKKSLEDLMPRIEENGPGNRTPELKRAAVQASGAAGRIRERGLELPDLRPNELSLNNEFDGFMKERAEGAYDPNWHKPERWGGEIQNLMQQSGGESKSRFGLSSDNPDFETIQNIASLLQEPIDGEDNPLGAIIRNMPPGDWPKYMAAPPSEWDAETKLGAVANRFLPNNARTGPHAFTLDAPWKHLDDDGNLVENTTGTANGPAGIITLPAFKEHYLDKVEPLVELAKKMTGEDALDKLQLSQKDVDLLKLFFDRNGYVHPGIEPYMSALRKDITDNQLYENSDYDSTIDPETEEERGFLTDEDKTPEFYKDLHNQIYPKTETPPVTETPPGGEVPDWAEGKREEVEKLDQLGRSPITWDADPPSVDADGAVAFHGNAEGWPIRTVFKNKDDKGDLLGWDEKPDNYQGEATTKLNADLEMDNNVLKLMTMVDKSKKEELTPDELDDYKKTLQLVVSSRSNFKHGEKYEKAFGAAKRHIARAVRDGRLSPALQAIHEEIPFAQEEGDPKPTTKNETILEPEVNQEGNDVETTPTGRPLPTELAGREDEQLGDRPEWAEGGDPTDSRFTLETLNQQHWNYHTNVSPGGYLWKPPSATEGIRPYLGATALKSYYQQGMVYWPESQMFAEGKGNAAGDIPADLPPGNAPVGSWLWTNRALQAHLPNILDSLHTFSMTVGSGRNAIFRDKVIRSELATHILNAITHADGNFMSRAITSEDLRKEAETWAPHVEGSAEAYKLEKNYVPDVADDTPSSTTHWVDQDDLEHPTLFPSLDALNRDEDSWDRHWPRVRQEFPYVPVGEEGLENLDMFSAEEPHFTDEDLALSPDKAHRFLKVTDVDGTEFNPMAALGIDEGGQLQKNWTRDDVQNMVLRLRDIYRDMHLPRHDLDLGDRRPTFGTTPVSPLSDEEWNYFPPFKDKKHEGWTDEKKEAFNKLMMNKAVVEKYLGGYIRLLKGTSDPESRGPARWTTDVFPAADGPSRSDEHAWQGQEEQPWLESQTNFWKDPEDGEEIESLPEAGTSGADNYSYLEQFLAHPTTKFSETFPAVEGVSEREVLHHDVFDRQGTPNFFGIGSRHWSERGFGLRENWEDFLHFGGLFGTEDSRGVFTRIMNADDIVKEGLQNLSPEGAAFVSDPDAWKNALDVYLQSNPPFSRDDASFFPNFGGWLRGETSPTDPTPRFHAYTRQGVLPLTDTAQTDTAPTAQTDTAQTDTTQTNIPVTEESPTTPPTAGGEEESPTPTLEQFQQGYGEQRAKRERSDKINLLMGKYGHDKGSTEYREHQKYLESLDPKGLQDHYKKDFIDVNLAEGKGKDKKEVPVDREKVLQNLKHMYTEESGHAPDEITLDHWNMMDDKKLIEAHGKQHANYEKWKHDQHMQGHKNKAQFIDQHIKLLDEADQENLTKERIVSQFRRAVHANNIYSEFLKTPDFKAQREHLHNVMLQCYKLADAAGFRLEDVADEDMLDAAKSGHEYGSGEHLKDLEGRDAEEADRREAHAHAVAGGAELRRNPNYKPHIVAKYDNGRFSSYGNLQTNEPLDPAELRFDEDNHHIFHGLDRDMVKKYLKYRELLDEYEDNPKRIPIGSPHDKEVDHSEFADLHRTIMAPDYKEVRERVGEYMSLHDDKLPTAKELFHGKFGAEQNRPLHPDGGEEKPPTFYRDGYNEPVSGWYHPESESWINPHRYNDLIDSMREQPEPVKGPRYGSDMHPKPGAVKQGSGRFIPEGKRFYGRDRAGERNGDSSIYSFAIPTKAKEKFLQNNYGKPDQSYYIDHSGAIAHMNTDFKTKNDHHHYGGQTHNDVIHDWYAQQIMNQYNANPNLFKEGNNLREVANIDSPQVRQTPIQNMFLIKIDRYAPFPDLHGPEHNLYPYDRERREVNRGRSGTKGTKSALSRQPRPQHMTSEWWERYKKENPMGRRYGPAVDANVQDLKEGWTLLRHPFSGYDRDPLSEQELGVQRAIDPSWQQQAYVQGLNTFDTLTGGAFSGISGMLLGPTGQIIRRENKKVSDAQSVQRDLYNITRKIPIGPRHPRGQTMADHLVAPGEQSARKEQYDRLKEHFNQQKRKYQWMKDEASQNQNPDKAKEYAISQNKMEQEAYELAQLDPELQTQWEDQHHEESGAHRRGISSMVDQYLGDVYQAPSAYQATDEFGSVMGQPQQHSGSGFSFPSHWEDGPDESGSNSNHWETPTNVYESHWDNEFQPAGDSNHFESPANPLKDKMPSVPTGPTTGGVVPPKNPPSA